MATRIGSFFVLAGALLACSDPRLRADGQAAAAPQPAIAAARAPLAANPAAPAPSGDAQAVAADVAAKNAAEASDLAGFGDAGWHFVDAPPPDLQVLAFNPAALAQKRDALRAQLASTTALASDVVNIAALARAAADDDLRAQAITALGRAPGADAQRALADLLPVMAPAMRARIVPLLRPQNIDDEMAGRLVGLLDDPQAAEVEKNQAAFALAVVAARGGRALSAAAAGALSAGASQRLAEMTTLVTSGSAP